MKIVTINLAERYLDCIEQLVTIGKYPSRSEVIREALLQFFKTEDQFLNGTSSQQFAELCQEGWQKYVAQEMQK
jgi:Arc/MetJ-type ribon-helix-helix transcriptional regulator